jgi:uncharacterized membrane protein YdjX (TVP38/TMEM64 family)
MLSFVGDKEAFQNYIDEKGIAGILVFGAFIFIQTLSTCIPGLPFYLAAGAVLGGVKGALICDAFAMLANSLAFILGKRYGRSLLCFLFPEDKLEHVENLILDKNPVLVHILFMLLPLPKDTYAWLGYYSKENLLQWMIITYIARFPHIFIYTYGAEKVLDNQYGFIIAGAIIATAVYAVVMIRLKKSGKN